MTEEEIAAANIELTRAYNQCFSGAAGQVVLADLAEFCQVTEASIVPGHPEATILAEGARKVFWRIQKFAKLTPDEIIQLRVNGRVARLMTTGEENG